MFRIGRKHASHAYPIPRAASSVPYARNFAIGPLAGPVIPPAGVNIVWFLIEAGAPSGTLVPITPKSTGIVRIHGVVTVKSGAVVPVSASVVVLVNGVALIFPLSESVTVPAGGGVAIPVLIETTPLLTPVGVLANIEIKMSASVALSLIVVPNSSSLEIQEVQAATG